MGVVQNPLGDVASKHGYCKTIVRLASEHEVWPHCIHVDLSATTPTMSIPLAPHAKRHKRSKLLVENDMEAAEAVTHEMVTRITRSGAAKRKTVLVPLVPQIEHEERNAMDPSHMVDFGGMDCNADADADADAGHRSLLKTSKVDMIQHSAPSL